MTLLTADYTRAGSLAFSLRKRRMRHFLSLLEQLPRPARLLDVGGTPDYWRAMELAGSGELSITVLNVFEQPESDGIRVLVGDARRLAAFEDGSFDVVFSNSVIEHVGSLDDQTQMAREIRRVGKSYFVQTPSRYFPIEPHFQFPFFQFLPRRAKIALLSRFSIGWYRRAESAEEAGEWADEIRLLTRGEMRRLFPEARIVPERVCGLTKSYMAVCSPRGA